MKIKVRILTEGCNIAIIKKGDWIDLRSSKKVYLSKGECKLIPLGISMKLPAGFEAIMVPRSSTYKSWGLTQWNSIGVIDNSYCGDNDEVMFPVIATRDVVIKKIDRICQFRIQLSQRATMWQKIKWLFSSKIEIEEVPFLGEKGRGGFGVTGKN